jgi:hypothetical protein
MRVCDKCKVRKVEKNFRIGDRDVELCAICFNHILEWLDAPEKKGLLDMFGGKK